MVGWGHMGRITRGIRQTVGEMEGESIGKDDWNDGAFVAQC